VKARAAALWNADEGELSREERKAWASELEREMYSDLVDAAVRGIRSRLARVDLMRSERVALEARLAELEGSRHGVR
jgi:hypothetical protein